MADETSRGRPQLPDEVALRKTLQIRMTEKLFRSIEKRGGSAWARKIIERELDSKKR